MSGKSRRRRRPAIEAGRSVARGASGPVAAARVDVSRVPGAAAVAERAPGGPRGGGLTRSGLRGGSRSRVPVSAVLLLMHATAAMFETEIRGERYVDPRAGGLMDRWRA